MNICDYGCNQKANYYFKTVNKWCCSKSHNSCPSKKKSMSMSRKGKKHPMYGKIGFWKNKKRPNHSKKMKGKNHPLFGKKRSKKTKEKISTSHKLTISKIKNRYPLFSKIEELRYNPDVKGEIQVHCKNHNCPNSKEQGGWFTPTSGQISKRIEAIENPGGFGESNLYCSEKCKLSCPLYRTHGADPLKNRYAPYSLSEINYWKQQVLKQDDYKCQKCGNEENLHCHHIIPVKTEPMFALDPDNGIALCVNCHYKYGHKLGTECSTGKLAINQC